MSIYLTGCRITQSNGIEIEFSEAVRQTPSSTPKQHAGSALNPSNYNVAGPLGIPLRLGQPTALGGNVVSVPLGGIPQPGTWYRVSVANVEGLRSSGSFRVPQAGVVFAYAPDVSAGSQVIDAIRDLTAYPVLSSDSVTERRSSSGGRTTDLGVTVDAAIGRVLGVRPRELDPRGTVRALAAAFAVDVTDGQTDWTWQSRSYAGQTDLGGGITGSQASLLTFARDAFDRTLPLIEGLYPLVPAPDPEDVESARAVLIAEWEAFVEELGTEGGPRRARADGLIERITESGGHLDRVEQHFGFRIQNARTLEEEEDFTNFLTVRDYINAVKSRWASFIGGSDRDLGTGLVLLSRALAVTAESVGEVCAAMDSVYVGPADRLTIPVPLHGLSSGTDSMLIDEILSWAEGFASEDGPNLIMEGGGRRGVHAMLGAMGVLRDVVSQLVNQIVVGSVLPDGLKQQRVLNPLNELMAHLNEVAFRAQPIVN